MTEVLSILALILYFGAALGLLVYGLNCYVLIALFHRGVRRAEQARARILGAVGDLAARPDVPAVTTQIAVFNEYNVVERCVRAVCRMRYPAGKHEVQVLDDSTDETGELVDRVAADLRASGHDVKVVRRRARTGYKAGALAAGLRSARGELVAVFDADFVPPEDYLLKAVPYFVADPGLGLVQARWGHLNPDRSLLTRAQSIGIDGHFMIEQAARNWNGLFMNFNGTGGLWRRAAIEAGGGWQWDTLTEDMDLSYRVQLAGWRALYLPDLVVPAEIPENVGAFKGQQFRWAKGSTETALKLLPSLLRTPLPAFKKLQAFLHMTHYLVHPLMLILAVLALPVLTIIRLRLPSVLFVGLAAALGLSMMAPSALYLCSQRAAYRRDWWRRVPYLPALVVLGVGLALSNSRAVMEAIIRHRSPFVRTPKRGDREIKHYRVKLPWLSVLEVGLGTYCAFSFNYYLAAQKYLVSPFLAVYAAGFLFVGLLTIAHGLGLAERR